jgi:hypothetical protein
LPASAVNVCGCEIVDAFVVSMMIIILDECLDLGFEVCWEVLIFQQDVVLQRLLPPLNLALGLRLI